MNRTLSLPSFSVVTFFLRFFVASCLFKWKKVFFSSFAKKSLDNTTRQCDIFATDAEFPKIGLLEFTIMANFYRTFFFLHSNEVIPAEMGLTNSHQKLMILTKKDHKINERFTFL